MVSEIKIVGRGVDTLVLLNICYTDEDFQPVKRELDEACSVNSTSCRIWLVCVKLLFQRAGHSGVSRS